MGITLRDVRINRHNQFRATTEHAAPKQFGRQVAKDPLYQIEPRATGRGDVSYGRVGAVSATVGPWGVCGWHSCRRSDAGRWPEESADQSAVKTAAIPGANGGADRWR